jgi:hypothetical protein
MRTFAVPDIALFKASSGVRKQEAVFDDRCNEVIKTVYRLMSKTVGIPTDIHFLIRGRCLIVPSDLCGKHVSASQVKPSHELDHIETGRKLCIMSTITPIDCHGLGRKM